MFELVTDWLSAGGVWALGLLMLLENVFPPIPSELIMPFAGYLAATGAMSPVGVIAFGTLGSLLGAMLWYWIGKACGRERFLFLIDRYGVWLTLSREETERAFAWFARWGDWAVFFGRLVPGVRTLISVPAGLADMPLGRFIGITAAGSLIWVSALTFAGYVLEANYTRVEHWIGPVTKWILIAVIAVYFFRVARQLLRRKG
jgi:membrane protein DedA with SNARE-associated domain